MTRPLVVAMNMLEKENDMVKEKAVFVVGAIFGMAVGATVALCLANRMKQAGIPAPCPDCGKYLAMRGLLRPSAYCPDEACGWTDAYLVPDGQRVHRN